MKKLKYTAKRVFNFVSVVTTNIDYTHEVLKKGNPSWKPHQISDVKIGDVVFLSLISVLLQSTHLLCVFSDANSFTLSISAVPTILFSFLIITKSFGLTFL